MIEEPVPRLPLCETHRRAPFFCLSDHEAIVPVGRHVMIQISNNISRIAVTKWRVLNSRGLSWNSAEKAQEDEPVEAATNAMVI